MRGLPFVLFVILLSGLESTESKPHDDSSETTSQYSPPPAHGFTMSPVHNVAYKVFHDFHTWDEARDRCFWYGGDLSIVHTIEKIQDIQKIDSRKIKFAWVGVYKPASSSKWKTLKEVEVPIRSIPWTEWSNPSEISHTRYCALIKGTPPKVSPSDCEQHLGSVCEISRDRYQALVAEKLAETTTTTTAVPRTTTAETSKPTSQTPSNSNLPNGYVKFPRFGTAYKMYQEYVTHHEAREKCFLDGGRLAVVDSFERIDEISAIPRNGSVHVGIRISSLHFEEWVVDSDGEPLKDLPWTPDNPHPTKCAALKMDGSGLEETLCSNRLQYLCEIQ